MSRVLLGVNIDHIATLRQARGTRYPEPVQAALVAEQAGAQTQEFDTGPRARSVAVNKMPVHYVEVSKKRVSLAFDQINI